MATVALSPNGLDRYELSAPPDRLLVATREGVATLRASNGTWSVGPRALSHVHVSALLVDGARNAVYAGSHGDGMFRWAGHGWEPISNGLTSRDVYSLAAAEEPAGIVLYAGTEPAYLFRSRDRGDSWEELPALRTIPGRDGWNFPAPPHIAHTKHIDIDPRDARTLFVAIEQGALLKSTDGGDSFERLEFQDETYVLNNDVHRVVFNPKNPDEMYVPGGDGISRSRDAGRTWEHVTTPKMCVGYPDATFYSPDGATVFTVGGGTPPNVWRQTGDAKAAIARTRDGGASWEALDLPELRGNLEAATLVSWPEGYGFFAGTSDGQIFASMDRGETWDMIASGLPSISKGIHYRLFLMGRGAA